MTGVVHPARVITNAALEPGLVLVLAKPLGTGVLVAGHRVGLARPVDVAAAQATMEQLNRGAAEVLQALDVRAATDITGFGLLGHALHLAQASDVTLHLDTRAVPLLDGALALAKEGCLPGAMFRNLEYVDPHLRLGARVDYERKMLLCDPQTSGGLFFGVEPERAAEAVRRLVDAGYAHAAVVGESSPREGQHLVLR